MEILRSKTKGLLQIGNLTEQQKENTRINKMEMDNCNVILESKPQRLLLELTNACNMKCIMCGRDEANFLPTVLDISFLKNLEPLLDIVEEVTLFGWGEPTLHPQFLDILKYLNNFPVRKYFVTNGMRLDKIKDAIFEYKVDIIGVSLDGAKSKTNDRIRINSNRDFIVKELKEIVRIKKEKKLQYPYINFVMTLFDSNIEELPDMVNLASEIGIEEVKAVYLTVFGKELERETLCNKQDKVKKIFDKALKISKDKNIKLKLPYIQGEDIAGNKNHKDCYVAWRDFFIGSDGYIRPCQSIPKKFFKYDTKMKFEDIWNSVEYQDFRKKVNSDSMFEGCRRCYQSSNANWNNRSSFMQIGEEFAPTWEK